MIARLRERQIVALAEIDAALEALNARRRAEDQAVGPRPCCANWSRIVDRIDGTDYWKCAVCGRVFANG